MTYKIGPYQCVGNFDVSSNKATMFFMIDINRPCQVF